MHSRNSYCWMPRDFYGVDSSEAKIQRLFRPSPGHVVRGKGIMQDCGYDSSGWAMSSNRIHGNKYGSQVHGDGTMGSLTTASPLY